MVLEAYCLSRNACSRTKYGLDVSRARAVAQPSSFRGEAARGGMDRAAAKRVGVGTSGGSACVVLGAKSPRCLHVCGHPACCFECNEFTM